MVELNSIKQQLDRIEGAALAQKNVLTLDEVVRFTGLSRSYLYKLTSTGRVPHSKPHGKVIYFDRQAVEAWLLKNPVKTASELEQEAVNYVVASKKGGRR